MYGREIGFVGENPRESRGTQVVLLLSDEDEPKKWGAKVLSQEGETFTIRIVTPPHLAVNKWKFSFDTVFNADDKCQVFRHPRSFPVYILFNPWCAGKNTNRRQSTGFWDGVRWGCCDFSEIERFVYIKYKLRGC